MKNYKIRNILLVGLIVVFSLTIGAKAATTIASSAVLYKDTTVEAALDELIGIANQCPSDALCSKVSVGDYVKMTPTETSYTILSTLTGYGSDQTINPSELNLWRVISINSDGTIDMVSEYVSSVDVYFQGLTGYQNLVGSLNLMASQYGNSKYTIRTRHMGYNGQTATITDTSKFTTTAPWTAVTSDNRNETAGGGDIMYTRDTELVTTALGTLVANKLGTTTANKYCLTSRGYIYGSSVTYGWYNSSVSASGNITYDSLYLLYNSGWYSNFGSCAIRPIVTLKSDITAIGTGTIVSPWVLS